MSGHIESVELSTEQQTPRHEEVAHPGGERALPDDFVPVPFSAVVLVVSAAGALVIHALRLRLNAC